MRLLYLGYNKAIIMIWRYPTRSKKKRSLWQYRHEMERLTLLWQKLDLHSSMKA